MDGTDIKTHENHVMIVKDMDNSHGYSGYAKWTIKASYGLVSNDGQYGRLFVKIKTYYGAHYKETLRFNIRINYGRGFTIYKQDFDIIRGNESTPDSDDGNDTRGVENIFITFGAI
eukprot:287729_1